MISQQMERFLNCYMPGEEDYPHIDDYLQAFAEAFSAEELALYIQGIGLKGPFTADQLRAVYPGPNFDHALQQSLDKYLLRLYYDQTTPQKYIACTKQEVHGAYIRDSLTNRRFAETPLYQVINEYILLAVNVGAGGAKIPTPQHLKKYKIMLDPNQAKRIILKATILDGRRVETTNDVVALIKHQTAFALSPCTCRAVVETQAGQSCHNKASCLFFNEIALHYTALGQGREITMTEAIDYALECGKKGLVHMTENVNDKAYVLCNCCNCCCMIMKSVQRGEIHSVMPSKYQPVYDAGLCVQCGSCVKICPGQALQLQHNIIQIDEEKCIGCGNCAARCPKNAITLELRDNQAELESKFDHYDQLNRAANSPEDN